MKRLAVALSLLSLGCAPARPAPQTAPSVTYSDELRWVRTSAEYRAIAIQTYRAALAAAERLGAGRPPGSWAVSVDADETLLDNSGYEKELQDARGHHTEAAWTEWLKRRARPAVPGAVEFLTGVRRLGGRVAVVTNTRESLCGDVAANLDAAALPYDILLCRPDQAGDRKEPRWQMVEAGTARAGVGPAPLLVFVGDNIQDFPGLDQGLRRKDEPAFSDFGVRFFALPNPLYGTWEKNPPE